MSIVSTVFCFDFNISANYTPKISDRHTLYTSLGIDTKEFVPLKSKAPAIVPVVHILLMAVQLCPFPEISETFVPEASSKGQCATLKTKGETVMLTLAVVGVFPGYDMVYVKLSFVVPVLGE